MPGQLHALTAWQLLPAWTAASARALSSSHGGARQGERGKATGAATGSASGRNQPRENPASIVFPDIMALEGAAQAVQRAGRTTQTGARPLKPSRVDRQRKLRKGTAHEGESIGRQGASAFLAGQGEQGVGGGAV